MAFKKGFWLALGAALASLGAFLLWLLKVLLGKPSIPGPTPIDQTIKLDEERKAEEARISGEIHADSDQALADRFNALASKQAKKKEEG